MFVYFSNALQNVNDVSASLFVLICLRLGFMQFVGVHSNRILTKIMIILANQWYLWF